MQHASMWEYFEHVLSNEGAPFSHFAPLLNEPQHATGQLSFEMLCSLAVSFFSSFFYQYQKD